MERVIADSELVINGDGTIFHLHLKPEWVADTVVLVGDPERVDMVASFFDRKEIDVRSREFHTITGWYGGKRITCVSHGIGPDNIEIVVTELDALKNVDFTTRMVKKSLTSLKMVRIGTSGGLQEICPVGTFVMSEASAGFDGMLNYYELPDGVVDRELQSELMRQLEWRDEWNKPYMVWADRGLVDEIGEGMVKGITITAPGFYGPQGRYVRIKPADMELNRKIMAFDYKGLKITNYEMESAALAGMARLLGHRAVTVCAIIAGRVAKNMNTEYKDTMRELVKIVLTRL